MFRSRADCGQTRAGLYGNQGRVSATLKHLHTIIAKECLWKMVQWARQHDPEFDSICSEEKRLRIEIEQIQRRIQLADNEKGEQNLPDAAKSTI